MNKKILVTFCLLLLTILCLAPQRTAAATKTVKLEDAISTSTVTGQAITATPSAIKAKFKVKRVKNNKVFQDENVKIKAGETYKIICDYETPQKNRCIVLTAKFARNKPNEIQVIFANECEENKVVLAKIKLNLTAAQRKQLKSGRLTIIGADGEAPDILTTENRFSQATVHENATIPKRGRMILKFKVHQFW